MIDKRQVVFAVGMLCVVCVAIGFVLGYAVAH